MYEKTYTFSSVTDITSEVQLIAGQYTTTLPEDHIVFCMERLKNNADSRQTDKVLKDLRQIVQDMFITPSSKGKKISMIAEYDDVSMLGISQAFLSKNEDLLMVLEMGKQFFYVNIFAEGHSQFMISTISTFTEFTGNPVYFSKSKTEAMVGLVHYLSGSGQAQ